MNKAQQIEVKLITTDYSNMRSSDYTKDPEFEPFRINIKMRGQKDPVLVRPHPKKKGKFQLIYGARRMAAILHNAVEAEDSNPTILARIEELNDLDARLEHTRENLGRVNCPAPDTSWALREVHEEFVKVGDPKSGEEVTLLGGAGISPGYGAQLLKIALFLHSDLFDLWRGMSREISVPKLLDICALPSGKQKAAWDAEFAAKAARAEDAPKGKKDQWAVTQGEKMGELLRFVYTLQAENLIPPEVDNDLIDWCVRNNFIKLGKKPAGKHYQIMRNRGEKGIKAAVPVAEEVETEEE